MTLVTAVLQCQCSTGAALPSKPLKNIEVQCGVQTGVVSLMCMARRAALQGGAHHLHHRADGVALRAEQPLSCAAARWLSMRPCRLAAAECASIKHQRPNVHPTDRGMTHRRLSRR